MKVIRANCRSQFTLSDYGFVVSVLNPEDKPATGLFRILQDEEMRDALLDKVELVQAMLEIRRCLQVSVQFYFYILVRHVFVKSGLVDRNLADYVASLLAEYLLADQMRQKVPGERNTPQEYLFEMLATVERLAGRDRFAMQAHIGNYALFRCGLFHRNVEYRVERRAAPPLSFYEELGSAQYRAAGDGYWAEQYQMGELLSNLGESFHALRLGLNEMAERLVFLGKDDAVESLLKEIGDPGTTPGDHL